MSCNCGCSHSYATANIVPCNCTTWQFNQIPPTLCSPPCCSGGSSSVKSQMLCCFGKEVTKTFFELYAGLTGHTDQLTVMDTQKPILITAMKDDISFVCDPEKVFERYETVSGLLAPIKTSIEQLSADPDYTTFQDLYSAFETATKTYFDYASSTQ